MTQRDRISINSIGVIMGIIMGLVYKDIEKCLITGIIVSSVITVTLSQKAKRANI
ncbi:MAG: hypothetical protein Q8934_21290 [Bacillota bacterium]|nr:hypothetical protein [Bacillota bacterium]